MTCMMVRSLSLCNLLILITMLLTPVAADSRPELDSFCDFCKGDLVFGAKCSMVDVGGGVMEEVCPPCWQPIPDTDPPKMVCFDFIPDPTNFSNLICPDEFFECVKTYPPTKIPTALPTVLPTKSPTVSAPTLAPTTSPTSSSPTTAPTVSPTLSPTMSPTFAPTLSPTTSSPTVSPTTSPTTSSPSVTPTAIPTSQPTTSPTTSSPSATPTAMPTLSGPTQSPTANPTALPTAIPTALPTAIPTAIPTSQPTTSSPSAAPTIAPTDTTTATTTATTTPRSTTPFIPTLAPTGVFHDSSAEIVRSVVYPYTVQVIKKFLNTTEVWREDIGLSEYTIAHNTALGHNAAADVYVVGTTSENLFDQNAGEKDIFLVKYDGAYGSILWSRQIGTNASDRGLNVIVDHFGNAVVTGTTRGVLNPFDKNATGSVLEGEDAFIASYSTQGDLRWIRQFGTNVSDTASFSVSNSNGDVLVYGYTQIDGTNWGVLYTKFDQDGNTVLHATI
eukprot:m.261542 g.261542  ORF g.261542 m.261542 type:complete len:502 (+) comp42392_c0_seq1:200-1705(+)